MNVKKTAIAALACLNLALLLILVLGYGTPQAQAQVYGTDYVIVTGNLVGSKTEALYVIDLAQSKMAVLAFDTAKGRLELLGIRNLRNDFRPATGMEVRP